MSVQQIPLPKSWTLEPGGPEFEISANGKGLFKGYELCRLVEVEHWYESTARLLFTEDGQTEQLADDLPDTEFAYDFNEKSREKIRKEFEKYPSLSEAIRHLPPVNEEFRDGRRIDIAMARSGCWHSLMRSEKLFKIHVFNWYDLAENCAYIAEIDMAGGPVDDLIKRVHEIVTIWENY